MEGKETTRNNNTENTRDTGTEENIAKITITKESEEAVSRIVKRVNDGFEGGRVNRQDVTSFLLVRACKDFPDDEISVIRNQFTSDIALLEAAMKKYKETGEMSPMLREILMNQIGLGAAPKKSKKSLHTNYVNDIVTNREAA